jgi:hypothetical protein
MMRFIYIAVPYSHPDAAVANARFELVTRVAGWLMADYVVFSPITHSHAVEQLWDAGVKRWDFWRNQDLEIISRVDEMHVLMLDGWRDSEGVQAEIEFCHDNGIPVLYIDPLALPEGLALEAKQRGLV